eukprot:CAMPEP_0206262526 /NCGR_PEP_ID=MMETSP0047_2-20121206/28288_1 /ASSEMBLY_ACC=CAM_ASM_000192 /TAXON_ID=195065 /ORGANISM="Chroomonas mesostigmatica_cf, Strain CCMP1168" /LENGTH=67 /DNA_ID=CAMNT_0053689919 /DNA_START=48 /DNA_END=248 /DNA_ORIENTATION=-
MTTQIASSRECCSVSINPAYGACAHKSNSLTAPTPTTGKAHAPECPWQVAHTHSAPSPKHIAPRDPQ